MLFNNQQIDDFVSDFEFRLRSGEIKKTVLPNTEDEYFRGIDRQDLDAILNADKDSLLFNMPMEG